MQNAKYYNREIQYLSVVVFGSDGNNGSNENYGRTIQTLLVIVGFSGLEDTIEDGTNEREIWGCQINLSRTYLSFVCNIRKDIPKPAS